MHNTATTNTTTTTTTAAADAATTNNNNIQTANNLKKSLQSDKKQIKKHNSPEPERKVGSKKAAWTIST
jgi:hypothetical protein